MQGEHSTHSHCSRQCWKQGLQPGLENKSCWEQGAAGSRDFQPAVFGFPVGFLLEDELLAVGAVSGSEHMAAGSAPSPLTLSLFQREPRVFHPLASPPGANSSDGAV